MSKIYRKEIADGVYFNSVRDSRFKTMKLSCNLFVPLRRDDASGNSLLAGVLSRSCKAYPDFTALSRKLSSLYGADLVVSSAKVGENQAISISASGIDDRYSLDGDSITAELSALLCGVIFEPNLTADNAFVTDEVEQERRQLLDMIDSEYNEKRLYANSRLIEIMCADEVFGIKRYGTKEAIQAATPQSLYDTWRQLLKTAVVEIMYIGDSAPDKAEKIFADTFHSIDRTPAALHTEVIREAGEVKRVTEEVDVAQAKLVMGFRAGVALPDKGTLTEALMSAILGGTATSKLFCNVREKQSLCYYCASRYDKHKGILMIDSGVESENIERLEKGVLKEIEDMKNGVISDFELASAKMALINANRSSGDTVGGIEAWYSSQLLQNGFRTVEEICAAVDAITKEEIVAAAQKLQLDTVYVLKNQEVSA